MDDAIRVILIDDDPRIRSSWERLMGVQPDMTLVATYSSADEFGREAPTDDAVALMDLSIPGERPLEVIARVRESSPACRVVVYSGHYDPKTAEAAHAAGAWGLVDKVSHPRDVLEAVRRASRGEMTFPRGTVGRGGAAQ